MLPYHLAIVVGGTSAEANLKTVNSRVRDIWMVCLLQSERGHAIRCLKWKKDLITHPKRGIGAQFGGKYFCLDVRVIRLPRHGASLPIGIGVSCSADRQALGKITKDGIFLEKLESNPSRFLPEVDELESGEVVEIDLNAGMESILDELNEISRENQIVFERSFDCRSRLGSFKVA